MRPIQELDQTRVQGVGRVNGPSFPVRMVVMVTIVILPSTEERCFREVSFTGHAAGEELSIFVVVTVIILAASSLARHRANRTSLGPDSVAMNSVKKTLDDAEGDEAAHVDVRQHVGVASVPFSHSEALSQTCE